MVMMCNFFPADSQCQLFMEHIAEFGLSYGTMEEFTFRAKLFYERHQEIMDINSAPNMTSTTGHNFLSTWTHGEKKRLLGYTGLGERNEVELEETNSSGKDWRDHGAVNAVQNQQSCGSCWAFSATAAMEAAHKIRHRHLYKLSEQQLVQCSARNHGCNGGSMALAFKFLESTMHVSESDYPYTSGRGVTGQCDSSKCQNGLAKVSSYTNVKRNNPTQLKAAIEQSVVSVAIEADRTVFQHYTGGVITSSSCGTNLDHGVAAVGYGTENGQEYFLVRNSWGPSWGDKGYVKIGVAPGAGICGINADPVYPTAL